ncbi:hypothetical protein BZJ19_16950, partial [Salinivibrio proteolyticus]|uniref:asparagine synthetase B family protein n=1 Tax=Salinivibrio proteolyticus TaxID=334715 RepID=UPI0009D2AF00
MCGITGFFSYKNKCSTTDFYNAHRKIAHRGPDDEGFIYRDSNGGLENIIGCDTISELRNRDLITNKSPSSLIIGHRRLSILDLTSQGHQPFSYVDLHLTYNGEIFNYVELRDELISVGYTFETQTDTEVFLKSYHYWGEDAFNKFNGMWAAAIYDSSKDCLLLTRDRFGIKPLYYSFIDSNFIFGSEIKFVSSFMDKLYPNEQMVYDYIEHGYISHTSDTFFAGIHQINPG